MEGCSDRATDIDFDSLEKTGTGISCSAYDVGTFELTCENEEQATITPHRDGVVVKMKGANGGTIYKDLQREQAYTLDVGSAHGISHIEFCFKCDDHVVEEVVTKSVRTGTTPLSACPAGTKGKVNHDAAQSIHELPVQVKITNDQSHFELLVNKEPYGFKPIPAYCVDYSRSIWGSTFNMDIFSAFDPDIISLYGGGSSSAVDFPDLLPNLGWLMNHIDIGDMYDDNKGCRGVIDWNEYQVALWYVIDDVQVGDSIHSYYNANNRQDCISQGLAKMAIEQGNAWKPDCSKAGELVPLLFIADSGTTITNQVLMGEVELASIEGMCECEPEVRTINECPDGSSFVVNHNAAKSITELPVRVEITNDQSHFDLIVSRPPYAPEGGSISIPAWCVDYSRSIWGSTFNMDVFSAFDPAVVSIYGGGTSSAVDFPALLPNLGWLMNNVNVGDEYNDGKGCAGKIDWNEYQVALWYVIDDIKVGDSIHSYYNGGGRTDCISQGLAKMAIDQGNGWTPDCMNPNALVPLLFIADSGTTITNQVLMGEVELSSIEGMCTCKEDPIVKTVTPAPTNVKTAPPTNRPTLRPTNRPTPGPTNKPTPAPTNKPTPGPTNKPTPGPTNKPTAPPTNKPSVPDETYTTSSPPGTKGDPHFKTHGGEMFDFHGGCDLVLLDNPDFLDGVGMTVHIRTKIETWWSYVESAAIQIGSEVLEIGGGSKDEWFFLNGKANDALEEKEWHRTHFAGLVVRYKQNGPNREAHIYLEGRSQKIMIKTYHDFVKVELNADGSHHFAGSHGILGRFPDGLRVGRDGETFIEDVNAYGQEWQVRAEEPKLFHTYDEPWVVPAGQKCAMPSTTVAAKKLRQRRLATGIPMEDAERACAHLSNPSDHKACVFDVIATQDTSMAAVW